jgi:hypothetical protein
MRYWFDTEFIEDGKTIDLISIGIVAEDGRELYLQNEECAFQRANQWVKENVLVYLTDFVYPMPLYEPEADHVWRSRNAMKLEIQKFIGHDGPEFWAYYADYDWVVLCQLFGTMIDLPKGWPMYCRDLKQWCDSMGNPKLPEQGKGEHHALADARWNKQAWEFLIDYEVQHVTYHRPLPSPEVEQAK